MTPTQLHPTDLIAVPVPIYASNIQRSGLHLFYDSHDGGRVIIRNEEIGCRFELLGTCTKSDIDFDVEPFVDLTKYLNDMESYMDYSNHELACYSSIQSFRSLLTANGLHFENPYNEVQLAEGEDNVMARVLYNQWQTAQNNLVEKLVILKRV